MARNEKFRWLHQKMANFLGDFKQDSVVYSVVGRVRREPAEHPSPSRAKCRIFFLVSLIAGFLALLVYNYKDSPEVRIYQVYHLDEENKAFPDCYLYNSSACGNWPTKLFPREMSVVCPCNTISVAWRDFVGFYTLQENSTTWKMSFSVIGAPNITVPARPLRIENIEKDTQPLTAKRFCNMSTLYPYKTNSSGSQTYEVKPIAFSDILEKQCDWMASSLFPGTDAYRDTMKSTQFMATPVLLNKNGLNILVSQLARESVLNRRLQLDMANNGNVDFLRFYNALARHLTGLLDREELNLSESYVYGARAESLDLNSSLSYDIDATVWHLEVGDKPIYVYPKVDWIKYRNTCKPMYCEVTERMRFARQVYWAFAILGGAASIILGSVKLILWPSTGTLLQYIHKRRAPSGSVQDPEHPQVPFMVFPSRSEAQ